MAVSTQDIVDFLQANPGMSDADIAKAMEQYGVSPAQMAEATGLSVGEVTSRLGAVIPADQAVLFGDTYVQPVYSSQGSGETYQQGPLENVITYKANENKVGGNVDYYDPTGQYQQTTQQQEVASFAGGIGEMLNDPFIQAALLTGGAGGFLGGALGLTGSTAQAVGTGLLKGGSALAGGADLGDALKAGLLSGGLVYGGSALDNYLTTGSTADVGLTERQLAHADAKQLIAQGIPPSQVADILDASGYNEVMVEGAIKAATKGLTNTLPVSAATDAVNITDALAPAVNTSGLLSSIVNTTPTVTPTTTPTTPVTEAGTVEVQGTSTPQQVDQSVLDLINSQLATNVTTPTTLPAQQTPLANVEVTAPQQQPTQTTTDVLTSLLPTITTPTVPSVVPETPVANVEVTGDKGLMSGDTTVTDILNTLAGIPTTPVTIPSVTTPVVPEQVITAETPVKTEDIISAITPTVTTPTVTPTVTTPTTPVTPEVVVTDKITTPTIEDFVTPITSLLPTITPTPVTISPDVTPDIPSQTIIAEKPTTITDVITPAVIPTITPTTPLTPTPVTTEPTNKTTNPLGLTDAQLFNILKAGLGLFGGAAAAGGGGSTPRYNAIPTQGVPQYSQDYFTQVQQNYNRLLPSTPRDVSTPLQDWYNSQYGA